MASITPRKLRVILDVRAWANVRNQKMGWLRPADVIEIVEEYQGWVRFNAVLGCADLLPLTQGYDEYWIEPDRADRFEPWVETPIPDPEPEPEPDPYDGITDREAGAALRTLLAFLREVIFD